ncbi:MAG: hypothetical protein V7K48_08670 [Nostoc sp.]|uniref:hypothetical protein n=1 Tax=Nostoc sp. TaxID=1180 RepID=UPI002FF4F30E
MNWHSDAVMLPKCNIYLIIKNTAFPMPAAGYAYALQAMWDKHSLVCFLKWYLAWGAKPKMASKLILKTARVFGC